MSVALKLPRRTRVNKLLFRRLNKLSTSIAEQSLRIRHAVGQAPVDDSFPDCGMIFSVEFERKALGNVRGKILHHNNHSQHSNMRGKQLSHSAAGPSQGEAK